MRCRQVVWLMSTKLLRGVTILNTALQTPIELSDATVRKGAAAWFQKRGGNKPQELF